MLVGLSLHLMNIDLTPVWYQEVNLLGTLGQGMELWPPDAQQPRSTFSLTAEMIAQGQLQPEKLVTHHFALDKYQHALMTAADKGQSRAIKVVFDYSLLPASVVPNVRASAAQRRPATVDVITPQVTARIFEEETKPEQEPQAPQTLPESHPQEPQELPIALEPTQEPQQLQNSLLQELPENFQQRAVPEELYISQAEYEAHEAHEEYEEQLTDHTLPSLPSVSVFDIPTAPIAPSVYEEPFEQEAVTPVVAEEDQTLAQLVAVVHEEPQMAEAATVVVVQPDRRDDAPAELEYVEDALPELEYVAEPEFAYEGGLEYGTESEFVDVETEVAAAEEGDIASVSTGPLAPPTDEVYGQEEGEETKNAPDTLLEIGRSGKTVISSATGAEQVIRRQRTRKKGNTRR